MRKRAGCSWLILCVIWCLFLGPIYQAQAAEANNSAKHFNVVFVMDGSGSLGDSTTDGGSDRDGWRYEALDLFLGLSTNSGNYVGAVVFNQDIVEKIDVAELIGNSKKSDFSRKLVGIPVGGQTNIGTALLEAVKMLDKSANRELLSAIILLTDGNTELSPEELIIAEKDKAEAIKAADANHYPVYSVCLNQDGSADISELETISKETGGAFLKVEKAEDIKEVFNQFYNMIYDTETVTLIDELIPQNGILEKDFPVPNFGVEEVNIIISTLNYDTTYTIYRPKDSDDQTSLHGKPLTKEELEKMTISARSFSVVKMIEPDPGDWKIAVKGTPGDQVKITMVYNADYSICLENEGMITKRNLLDKVNLSAFIIDGTEKINNPQAYEKITAVLSVEHDGEQQNINMSAGDDNYTAEFLLDDYGTYIFSATMPIDGMEEISGKFTVQVDNRPPQAAQESMDWDIRSWTGGKKTYSCDISSMASDAEDSSLRYMITNIEPQINNEELKPNISEDGVLSFYEKTEIKDAFKKPYKKQWVLTIQALDSQNAACEFRVNVSFVAFFILMVRAGAVAVVLLLLLLLGIFWRSRHRKFNGETTIATFDNNKGGLGRSKTISPVKGVVVLGDYIYDSCGIDLGRVRIQAVGKDYIYLKSSKGYYSSVETGKKKKIKLRNLEEVTISNNEELSSGIKIMYCYNGNSLN